MHATRCALLCVGIVLVSACAVKAQSARDDPDRASGSPHLLSEEASVRLGLEHNLGIAAARAEAAEAQAMLRQRRADRLPVIQSLASYTRISGNIPEVDFTIPGFDTTFTLLPIELDRYYSEISIEQPLFAGFRLTNQVRAAAHEAEAAALRARREEADVAFEIRRAYWTLYQAVAVRQTMDAAFAQMEAHLRDVRNRVEAGAALSAELLSARTRRSEIQLDRLEAEKAVQLARLELNRLTGLPLDAPSEVEADEAPVDGLPDRDSAFDQALDSHPQLGSLNEQVRALQAVRDVTRGDWLPEVSAVGRYVYARPNQYFFLEPDRFHGSWEAGVSMRWRLLDSGRRRAVTAGANERLHAAEARLADLRRQAEVALTRQYLEFDQTTEAVGVATQAVEEAAEALRMTRFQYTEGAALSTEVLDAEQMLRSSEVRHARAVAQRAIARAALLNALGRTW